MACGLLRCGSITTPQINGPAMAGFSLSAIPPYQLPGFWLYTVCLRVQSNRLARHVAQLGSKRVNARYGGELFLRGMPRFMEWERQGVAFEKAYKSSSEYHTKCGVIER